MSHSIEIDVYHLSDPDAESFDEVPLEVRFNVIDNNCTEIVGYFIDNKKVSLKEIKKHNLDLTKNINYKIDDFIANLEPESDYFDCE